MQQLTMALVGGPLTDPLLTRDITLDDRVEWNLLGGSSVDQNSRQMLEGAYDVAEMSFSTFVKAREIGRDLIGLPIFTGRGFLQPGLIVSTASEIGRPEDLAGKRVGVPQFWMTSTVWHRLILERWHAVPENAIRWFVEVDERFDEVPLLPGVEIQRLEGKIGEALAARKIDAMMVPPRGAPASVGGDVRWPYPDVKRAESDFFSETGIFPIMHFIVMKESVYRRLPWLAESLTSCFAGSKKRAVSGGLIDELLWPFGLDKNAKPLDAFLSFAAEKRWIAPERTTAEFFVEN